MSNNTLGERRESNEIVCLVPIRWDNGSCAAQSTSASTPVNLVTRDRVEKANLLRIFHPCRGRRREEVCVKIVPVKISASVQRVRSMINAYEPDAFDDDFFVPTARHAPLSISDRWSSPPRVTRTRLYANENVDHPLPPPSLSHHSCSVHTSGSSSWLC